MNKQIINIVNFIRGCEPRQPMDLYEPVENQLAILQELSLKSTFLFQYDALINERFTSLFDGTDNNITEKGVWLEIPAPLARAAGIIWRGRYEWDWHADTGFSVGYTLQERERLIDVLFAKFRDIFGSYPKSVGSWIIDAHSLKYMHDKYGIISSCNCKDQWGTDGYTLWGGYWNQAYYPSVNNAFCPASHKDTQIAVPVFRMLGSDPVEQYDYGVSIHSGLPERQGVRTLEPVYCNDGGGGDNDWTDWFFRENFSGRCLSFAYAQAGQENSFGWESMKDGFIYQCNKIARERARGNISVETLFESGKSFKESFALTPPTSVAALTAWKDESKKSVWYNCRNYRMNIYAENGVFFIRDFYIFNDLFKERYLCESCLSPVLFYSNLPVTDSARESGGGIRAGIHFFNAAGKLSFGNMIYEEPDCGTVRLTFSGTACGNVVFTLCENSVEIKAEKAFYARRECCKSLAEVRADTNSVSMLYENFSYSLKLANGEFKANCIIPDKNSIIKCLL